LQTPSSAVSIVKSKRYMVAACGQPNQTDLNFFGSSQNNS
jgi:hypothetical protein